MEEDEPPAPWTGAAKGVVVAAVVGVGMLMLCRRLWWGRRGCRRVEMGRVVEAERGVLYRFLCDPNNLKVIHPYTTDIQMKEETEEEGGVTLKEFDWVEKVPFTVVSAARMRCDPTTSTITIDVIPAGGMHEVQLKWCLKPHDPGSSGDLIKEDLQQTHQTTPTHPQQSGLSTDSERNTAGSADDKKTLLTSSADDRAVTTERSSSPDEELPSTEFHNHIQVTGSSVLVAYIVIRIIVSIENKLMDRLQSHFKKLR
ncbi:uncharacterized protein LOC143282521 isoform X1 [Babylonia areolata]